MPDKYAQKDRLLKSSDFKPISTEWKSPSNIALVKYWGKHGRQLPSNPSVSFTLDKAHTITTIDCSLKEDPAADISVDFIFERQSRPEFSDRIKGFLSSITDIFPFLKQVNLKISSKNSFPHSSGIASSASSMSALALGLCEMERQFFGGDKDAEFFQKSSYISRLASGSACRSIYPIAAMWGYSRGVKSSSDEYAIPVAEMLHPIFHSFRDSILVVNDRPKSVSSSAGHQLMDMHLFASERFQKAGKNVVSILDALRRGEVEETGKIIESEALMLHAMMLSSNPSFILFEPETIAILKKVREYRADSDVPLYFTLDAGPNVHLLYPDDQQDKVERFINGELMQHCISEKCIFDRCGAGPVKLR
ncbi:MAG: diphosphomevalonate decarboxylase [Saprospirales bacterium]|nr:MAG: diphosphomevalonate decarboxylase [Saprospirales bacterium]